MKGVRKVGREREERVKEKEGKGEERGWKGEK